MERQSATIDRGFPQNTFSSIRLQRACACGSHTHGGGECESCRQRRQEAIGSQRAASRLLSASSSHNYAEGEQAAPQSVYDVLRAPGHRLDDDTRAFMESRFNENFSGVRVHTDSQAAESARAVDALAYTVGQNVIFEAGQYQPGTERGRRLLAHELVHTIQQRGAAPGPLTLDNDGETVAQRASLRALGGQRVALIPPRGFGIARTPTSAAIQPLIFYALDDWEVTAAEERTVLSHLRADPDVSRTIIDLNTAGMLDELINRVDETANRRELLQILGARLNAGARALVEPLVRALGMEWELQFNLGALGVTAGAPAFNPAPFSHLVGTRPEDPFSGVGATGINPTTLDIPLGDQAGLAIHSPATTARYSNPIPGSLPGYLAGLSAADRSGQAELMLRRPISSVMASSYAGNIPSRAQIITAAATRHNLEPRHLAAFLLAEQRDQSRNEDAKDYLGATSIMSPDLSIGMGQVVISTAQRHDLFADTLSSSTRGRLGHDETARLLASDEFNIFAAARYIRRVADDGSTKSIAALPNTAAEYPGIDMAAYAGHSSAWPDDNIRALGSEYTSTAWDDSLVPAWGEFVYQALQDVIASGVL